MTMEVPVKDVAQFLKVLADESRLQILWLLFNHEELCVCELVEALGVSQSKVSRHLATLRHTGLVTDRRDGAWSFYSLRLTDNELERAVLDALREKLADHTDGMRVLQNLNESIKGMEGTPGGACRACGPRAAALKSAANSPRRDGT